MMMRGLWRNLMHTLKEEVVISFPPNAKHTVVWSALTNRPVVELISRNHTLHTTTPYTESCGSRWSSTVDSPALHNKAKWLYHRNNNGLARHEQVTMSHFGADTIIPWSIGSTTLTVSQTQSAGNEAYMGSQSNMQLRVVLKKTTPTIWSLQTIC